MTPATILAATHAAPHPPSTITAVLWAAAVAFLFGAGYAISIRRHPYRPCRRCGESGKRRGTVYRSSFRDCHRCGGTGRELRPFARKPDPPAP
jgi:hypothetical protein